MMLTAVWAQSMYKMSLTETNTDTFKEKMEQPMIKNTFHVKSFRELHETIQEILNFHGALKMNTIFRGHKSIDYKLIPKVGRIEKFTFYKLKIGMKSSSSIKDQEKNILRQFKHRALPLLTRTPSNNWEWLAIGQHHGLATRLLDWSKNPLVAAYFAVRDEYKKESVIFSYNKGFYSYSGKDPFDDITGVQRISPASYTRRIEAQSGVFTVHENPRQPLENIGTKDKLHKIVIEKSFRNRLKNILSGYGIHRASMFPDLDGMAYFVNDYSVKKWG